MTEYKVTGNQTAIIGGLQRPLETKDVDGISFVMLDSIHQVMIVGDRASLSNQAPHNSVGGFLKNPPLDIEISQLQIGESIADTQLSLFEGTYTPYKITRVA